MKRNELFAGLKETAVNKVPVSPRDIKEQLEDIGFKVTYRFAYYTEFREHGYPEHGHFTQWLYYNNRRYGAIVYTVVKEDDGTLNTYISQCFCNVCPRYTFSISGIKRDLSVKINVIRMVCSGIDYGTRICAIYDESPDDFSYIRRGYRRFDRAVRLFTHSDDDSLKFEYENNDDVMYRETYKRNSDGSYTAEKLDITHLECEDMKFYIVG